jgi:hypothetical protein
VKSLALLAIGLVSVSVGACGGPNKGTGSTSHASSNAATGAGVPTGTSSGAKGHGEPANDADDGDFLTPEDRNDDHEVVEYGHAAGAADKQVVTAFARRYVKAAAAEDGATACSMIIPSLVKLIPKSYGRPADSSYMIGNTCAEVMSKLFKHLHRELATEAAGLRVTGVRVRGNRAYALMAFTTTPEPRYLVVERVGGVWKTNELIYGNFP